MSMKSKVKYFCLLLGLAFAIGAYGQTAPATVNPVTVTTIPANSSPSPACNLPPELCANAFTVSLTGAYSNFQNVPTNNGFMGGAEVQLAAHWIADARIYSTANPTANILQFGPSYYGSLAKILPSTGTFNSTNLAYFVGGGLGLGWSTATIDGSQVAGPKKFAFSVGGGLDYHISDQVSIRLIDLRYVHCPILQNSGQFISNIPQISTGLTLSF